MFLRTWCYVFVVLGAVVSFCSAEDLRELLRQIDAMGARAELQRGQNGWAITSMDFDSDSAHPANPGRLMRQLTRLSIAHDADAGDTALLEQVLANAQPIDLSIWHKGLSNRHLSQIAKMNRLRRLHLRNGSFTDEGLACFAGDERLEFLQLPNHVGRAGLIKLGRLPHLKTLWVRTYISCPEDTRRFPELESAHIVLGKEAPAVVDLSGFEHLRDLDVTQWSRSVVRYPVHLREFATGPQPLDLHALVTSLTPLRELRSLRLECCSPPGPLDLRDLVKLRSVRSLCLERATGALSVLKDLPWVRELKLDSLAVPLVDGDFGAVAPMAELERLEVRCAERLKNESLEKLGELHNLKHLSLREIPGLQMEKQKFLRKMPRLTSLEIECDSDPPTALSRLLAQIPHPEEMESLSMHNVHIDASVAPMMKKLAKLRRFTIARATCARDVNLADLLASLPAIEVVTIEPRP